MSDDRTLPEKFVSGVVAHINEDHRREMLDLAHGLAGQRWARDAELRHADRDGIELVLRADDREEPLRVPFDAPLDKPNQFRPALIALIGRARASLGLREPTEEDTTAGATSG